MPEDDYAYVLTIRDQWWQKLRARNQAGKQVHSYVFAGQQAPPKRTSKLFFYVVKPVGEIAAYADFIERRIGDIEEMWDELGDETVFASKEQFKSFLNGKGKAVFVRFQNLKECSRWIKRETLLVFLGRKKLPQRGLYIDKKTAEKLMILMG